MQKIEFKNGYCNSGTIIPDKLWELILELTNKKIIKKDTSINAEFLNFVHLEEFIENKDMNEIKRRIENYYKLNEEE